MRRPPRAKWAFGDGKRASGRKVSHVFKRRGRYKVVLTLIDASGAKASVRKVAVVRR